MSLVDIVGFTIFFVPCGLALVGGSVYLILEALSPIWWIAIKERRKARIQAVKSEIRKETRGE